MFYNLLAHLIDWSVCCQYFGRLFPIVQVLLLCGPPGLGKTTLAHVAAKHCGYRVVEVLSDSLWQDLTFIYRYTSLLITV